MSGIIQLIQDYKQKSAELKEKYRILETELADCKHTCDEKNKLLQKSRLKYTNVIGVRDSLLIDLSKARMQLLETRSQIEEQRGEIKKMSGMINAAEEEMVKLRKRQVSSSHVFQVKFHCIVCWLDNCIPLSPAINHVAIVIVMIQ